MPPTASGWTTTYLCTKCRMRSEVVGKLPNMNARCKGCNGVLRIVAAKQPS